MNDTPILTIAVPTYNMERWLEKNLKTYCDKRLRGRLEVLCINNNSEDSSKEIIDRFCASEPEIFCLIDRSVDDYGAAINDAIAGARGMYFRIVDADDWVNTNELVRLVDMLENSAIDVVLTDYQTVSLQTNACSPIKAGMQGVEYGKVYTSLEMPMKTLPSVHCITYRTSLLRECGFAMQTGVFYADEEFVILPWLYVKTAIYYPFDVYRYLIANPNQSMSPGNRAKYYQHREKILRRLIHDYHVAENAETGQEALAYCRGRIALGVGDYFTTLYLYIENRADGRKLAAQWKQYLLKEGFEFWVMVKKKVWALRLLNVSRVSLAQYVWLKKFLFGSRYRF